MHAGINHLRKWKRQVDTFERKQQFVELGAIASDVYWGTEDTMARVLKEAFVSLSYQFPSRCSSLYFSDVRRNESIPNLQICFTV